MSSVRLTTFVVFACYVLASSARNLSTRSQQTMKIAERDLYKGKIDLARLLASPEMVQLRQLDVAFNNTCIEDILAFLFALNASKLWAITMLDSFGKPSSGLLNGAIRWHGSFSQCRSVVQEDGIGRQPFRGEFCWVHLGPKTKLKKLILPGIKIDIPLDVAICAPNTCQNTQLLRAGKMLLGLFTVKWLDEYVDLRRVECIQDRSIWESSSDTFFIYLLCGIVLIVVMATVYDLWQRHSESKGTTLVSTNGKPSTSSSSSLFLVFSAYTNGKKILDLNGSSESIPAVNGLRVISMLWVVWAHSYMTYILGVDNPLRMVAMQNSLYFTMIRQGLYSVDTFFFLGGFLLTYTFLKTYKGKANQVPWLKFYLYRYFRVFPPLVLILAFGFCGLGLHLGLGPFARIRWTAETEICKKYWWVNLMYFNNFMPYYGQCMPHTWYMACDIQLYALSPILLIQFLRSHRRSMFIALVGIFISCLIPGYIGITHDIALTFDLEKQPPGSRKFDIALLDIYFKPYTRISPYIVGMLTGWYLHNTQSIGISKGKVLFGWTICLMTMLTTVFIVSYPISDSAIFKAVYHLTSRLTWAISLAWLVVACYAGYGGIINTFLSLRIWNPLSRICYCAYLWQPIALLTMMGGTEVTVNFAVLPVYMLALANVIFVFSGAVIVTLLFEAPFVSLISRFLRGPKSQDREETCQKQCMNNLRKKQKTLYEQCMNKKTMYEKQCKKK